jgi:hypothetical protein
MVYGDGTKLQHATAFKATSIFFPLFVSSKQSRKDTQLSPSFSSQKSRKPITFGFGSAVLGDSQQTPQRNPNLLHTQNQDAVEIETSDGDTRVPM